MRMRIVAVLAACGGLALAGGTVPALAAPAGHAVRPATTTYYGIQEDQGLCLNAEGSTSGSKVDLEECNPEDTLQVWSLGTHGALVNEGSRLCLSPEDDSKGKPNTDGDQVEVAACNSSSYQDWLYESLSYVNDYASLCLEAVNNTKVNPADPGDNVVIDGCTGNPNQEWLTNVNA
jgi:hypothetical protein